MTSSTGVTTLRSTLLPAIKIPIGIPITMVTKTETISSAMVCTNAGHSPNAPIKNNPAPHATANQILRVANHPSSAIRPKMSQGGVTFNRFSMGNKRYVSAT